MTNKDAPEHLNGQKKNERFLRIDQIEIIQSEEQEEK
jgi:hypothetical protein